MTYYELLLQVAYSGHVSAAFLAPPCKEYSRLKIKHFVPRAPRACRLRNWKAADAEPDVVASVLADEIQQGWVGCKKPKEANLQLMPAGSMQSL